MLQGVVPLLYAGITAYSRIKHWNIGKERRVAVLGLGGIGHVPVKFAIHNISADVEVIQPQDSNTAFERMLKGDVQYRLTIDMSGL